MIARRKPKVLHLLLAAIPVLSIACIGNVAAASTWVGTWAASPQSSSTTFAQQTLRQIVHTSIAGTAARVQLSNAFGSQPVTIADVHVARRDSGSSVVVNSDVAVTFGGQSSVTIAVGDVAISDSIAFPVAALSDVAVSIYVPSATGPATSHGLGLQTNYVASGDVSGSATLSSPQTNQSYYFLANLDVQNPSAIGAVVTMGASITDGYQSTSDANERWPNDLAVRLIDGGPTVGVLNQGISGNQLLVDGSGQSAQNRFQRDALSQPDVQWIIFSDDPINDLGSSNPPTSDALIAGLQQLISEAHAAGLKYLCSTLTPYEGASYWTPTGETGREQINAFIRGADSGCDGIVDQDTATHDPSNPTQFLPAYDSGDHLHPNDLGYQAIANCVDLSLFTVPSTSEDGGASADADVGSLDAGEGEATDGGNVSNDARAAITEGGAGNGEVDAAPELTPPGNDDVTNPNSGVGCSCATVPDFGVQELALALVALMLWGIRKRHLE